jgi:hypothetical protein
LRVGKNKQLRAMNRISFNFSQTALMYNYFDSRENFQAN